MENKTGFIKFKSDLSQGGLHYVELDGKTVALTLGDSRKMSVINETGNLGITSDMKSEEFQDVSMKVITEVDTVKSIFDRMAELNHTHFNEWDDNIVGLEFNIPRV